MLQTVVPNPRYFYILDAIFKTKILLEVIRSR